MGQKRTLQPTPIQLTSRRAKSPYFSGLIWHLAFSMIKYGSGRSRDAPDEGSHASDEEEGHQEQAVRRRAARCARPLSVKTGSPRRRRRFLSGLMVVDA